MHQMIKNEKMKKNEIQRIKAERGISYTEAKKQMDIFNSVKTAYAQAAAATKPVVKTVTVETQTEMTWPDGLKQPKKWKISQSKVYLTKEHKGSNDPITQYNKYDALSDSASDMSVEESSIKNSQGWGGNKSVNNGTKQK